MLDTSEGRRPYPGDNYFLPFGCAEELLKGTDLTIITWAAMVHRCLEAATIFAGHIHLHDLRTIIPWDQDAVLESVHHNGKVLIVHEDNLTSGFGAEIAAIIACQAFTDLDAPIYRLAAADIPIPYNIGLMNKVLPGVDTIRSRIMEMLKY